MAKQNRFAYTVSFILFETDGKTLTIEDSNYIPTTSDFDIYNIPTSLMKISTGSTDFLFDTECDNYPTAVTAINTVSTYATNQNYSVEKLLG